MLISFSKIIKESTISIGIGSVGISATPILPTIVLTSGKLEVIIFSASSETLIDSDNELPGFIIICIAISPSSNFGINSPPILEKTTIENTNISTETAITVFLNFKAFLIKGSYTLNIADIILLLIVVNQSSNLENQPFLFLEIGFKNKDAITGT